MLLPLATLPTLSPLFSITPRYRGGLVLGRFRSRLLASGQIKKGARMTSSDNRTTPDERASPRETKDSEASTCFRTCHQVSQNSTLLPPSADHVSARRHHFQPHRRSYSSQVFGLFVSSPAGIAKSAILPFAPRRSLPDPGLLAPGDASDHQDPWPAAHENRPSGMVPGLLSRGNHIIRKRENAFRGGNGAAQPPPITPRAVTMQ